MDELRTARLVIRRLSLDDAPFIHSLVNDADWLRHIGDRGVHSLDDARRYLETGPLAMYAEGPYGLRAVQLPDAHEPLGVCGLLRRAALDAPDLAYAFLPAARGRGYAREAAEAMLTFGYESLGLGRIVAIVSPENAGSIRVLGALGMQQAGTVRLTGDADALLLFTHSPGA